jgi:hypothetical protein
MDQPPVSAVSFPTSSPVGSRQTVTPCQEGMIMTWLPGGNKNRIEGLLWESSW